MLLRHDRHASCLVTDAEEINRHVKGMPPLCVTVWRGVGFPSKCVHVLLAHESKICSQSTLGVLASLRAPLGVCEW